MPIYCILSLTCDKLEVNSLHVARVVDEAVYFMIKGWLTIYVIIFAVGEKNAT